MPMRDSWPCGATSGSTHSVNSAGSCDSMISINSGYSDNSMEHLSAEERACLMFLEETIESLEAEDHSGVSNDEADRLSRNLTNKMAQHSSFSQAKPQELSVHEDPNKILGKDHKPPKFLVPTPLVLANGNSRLLKKTDFSTADQKPAMLFNAPKSAALNSHQSSTLLTSADLLALNPGRHEPHGPSRELTDLPPSFIPEPPFKPESSNGAPAEDNAPVSNRNPRSDQKHKGVSSNMSMELLPPPSDFMDEPGLRPLVHPPPAGQSQPQISTRLSSQPASQLPLQPRQNDSMPIAPPPGFDANMETNKPLTLQSTSPRGQLSFNELDKLRKKASMKKAPDLVPVVTVKAGHNVSEQAYSPTFFADTSFGTGMEYGEPKSPPTVAPKPKRLPTSIVLKSHKDAPPGHSLVSPGDRMMINQQKVHLEALKKLGLLRNVETDSGLSLSPPLKTSPQASINASAFSEPVPDPVLAQAEHHALVEEHGKTDFSFSPAHLEKGESLLITREPSLKLFDMKSASTERSGVGLKNLTLDNASQLTGQEESAENVQPPLQQINRFSRTSLGSYKDLGTDHTASETNRETEHRRSLPITIPSAAQPKVESQQKSLRSHGISVVISPQSSNGEDRKQALKRLGLIKD